MATTTPPSSARSGTIATDVVAAEIVENLQAALEAFQAVADELAAGR